MRILLLLLIFMPTLAVADRILVADCVIPAGGSYFKEGAHFVIGFNLDTQIESIWHINQGKLEWYASDAPGAPFETNGGVWSITMASDVRKSLRKLPFRFYETTFPPAIGEFVKETKICEMDYSQIIRYDRGQ